MFSLSYMCYRLLGSALPLLSLDQLQMVLKGKVMQHYGEHVVTTQVSLLKVVGLRDKAHCPEQKPLLLPFHVVLCKKVCVILGLGLLVKVRLLCGHWSQWTEYRLCLSLLTCIFSYRL